MQQEDIQLAKQIIDKSMCFTDHGTALPLDKLLLQDAIKTVERLQKVVELSAVPLESLYCSGAYKQHSPECADAIEEAVRAIREASLLMSKQRKAANDG